MGCVTVDEARLQARYPKRTLVDYLIGGIALLAVLAAIAVVLFSGLVRANPAAVGMVRGFEVVSPTKLVAEIVVQRKDPTDPVVCRLFAQAVTYERVAEASIEIPPGTETLTDLKVDLQTIKEATTVEIEECRVTG